jgi:hypothetical protein
MIVGNVQSSPHFQKTGRLNFSLREHEEEQQYPSLIYKKTNKKEQIKMPVMFYLYVCFSVLYPYEESALS